MKKYSTSKIIVALLWVAFTYLMFSCEQVVDLKLDNPPRQLVVEGRIEKGKNDSVSEQMIRLTTISDFFVNQEPPAGIGAEVWVEDDAGTRFDFVEQSDGVYVNSELQGELGRTYTLTIAWEGQTFQASESMVSVSEIDSIYQIEAEENLFEDGGIKVAINFTDPANVGNYYFWETYVDGELDVLPDPGNKNNLIANDDFFDGQQVVGYLPNEEMVVEAGEEVLVRQYALSDNAYKYYYALYDQAGKTGSILDTPPAPVRGNIVNLTRPDEFPLGYFYVTEVDERIKIITNGE